MEEEEKDKHNTENNSKRSSLLEETDFESFEKEFEKALRNFSSEESENSELTPFELENQLLIENNEIQKTELSILSTGSFFDFLPDETILRILSFLDAPLIGRVSQVCKRFRELSYDILLWKTLSISRNWDSNNNDALIKRSRSFYLEKFLAYRWNEKQKEQQLLEESKQAKRQRHRTRASKVMKLSCYGRHCEWLTVFCIILTTILGVLKLDNVLHTSWGVIFIPLYFILLQMIGAPLLFDLMRITFKYEFDRELEPDENPWCGPLFFFLLFLLPLQEHPRVSRMVIYPLSFTFIIWLLLLFIRINGFVKLTWWGVFIPLIIFLLMVIQIPLWVGEFNVFTDDQKADRIMIVIGIVILIVFIILLALRLDGIILWNWFYVLIPLFVLEGLIVFVPLILTISSFIFDKLDMFWFSDHTRWADAPFPLCLTSIAIAVLVLIPLLTFQCLLARNLEAASEEELKSFSLIFVPIFLLEGFGVCACCIVNLAFICAD